MSLSVLPPLMVRRLQNGNASRKLRPSAARQTLRERQRHFDEPIPLFDSGEPTLLDIGVDALLKKINSQVSRAW